MQTFLISLLINVILMGAAGAYHVTRGLGSINASEKVNRRGQFVLFGTMAVCLVASLAFGSPGAFAAAWVAAGIVLLALRKTL